MTILLNEANSLYTILSAFTEQKLPIKLSYKLMKILSSLEPELDFYRTQFQNLIQECAEKDDEGNFVYTDETHDNIKIIPSKTKEFTDQYQELFNMEIEIDDFNFTLDELDNLSLTPKELYTLNPYILESGAATE